MIFDSLDNLVQDYKNYMNKKGFEAIIQSIIKKDDGDVKYMTLTCSCHDKPRSNYKNSFKMHIYGNKN